jgi:glutathione S-transferase
MAQPKLVYFPTRGRAEFIRLALVEAGVDYEEENIAPGPDFRAAQKTPRLPFQAFPLWEEDDLKLAQSVAIMNHIGRAHGLRGKTPREEALVDQAFGAVEDVREELRRVSRADPTKRADVRADLMNNSLPRWCGNLERLLASNRDGQGFLVGDSLSVADLALWYCIEIIKDNGFGSALNDCPKLNAFFERIAARPKIAAYLKSPKRWPLQKLPT